MLRSLTIVAHAVVHRVVTVSKLLLTILVVVVTSIVGGLEIAPIVDVSSLLLVHHLMWKLSTSISHTFLSRWTSLPATIIGAYRL